MKIFVAGLDCSGTSGGESITKFAFFFIIVSKNNFNE